MDEFGDILLLFAHLLAGVILGLILSEYFQTDLAIPACLIGAWLPDLFDKPLALQFTSFCSGRTVGHSLIAVGLVLVLFLILSRAELYLVIGLPISMLIHQSLDQMWRFPATWLYPLLGDFYVDEWVKTTGGTFFNYFGSGNTILNCMETVFFMEIADPAEWIALIILLTLSAWWVLFHKDVIVD